MGAFDDYYRVLELEPGAAPDEVRKAYRQLAKMWHPDRVAAHPTLRRKAEDKMKKINEAYEMLRDLDPGPAARKPRPPEPEPPRPEPAPAWQTPPEYEEEEEPEPAPPPPRPNAWSRLRGTALGQWGPRIKIKPRVRLRRKGAPAEGARSISVLRLALVLFAAILTNLAYFVVNQPLVDQPYYTILRMMVSFASLYAASCALYLRCEELLFILLPVAILFNPILPVAISFEEWFALNWFIPALLLYVLFALHMRNQPQD